MYLMEERIKIICITMILCASICIGAFLEDIPVNLHQPDGSILSCFSSGDEYYVRLHNADDYTIIQNIDDGFYYYAQLLNSEVVPTHYLAGQPLPEMANLQPGIHISKENYSQRRNNKSQGRGRDAPTIGTINNINIFIRFADEAEFGTPRSIMDEPFNKPEGPSIAHYYDEVSYSQVEVITHHFPVCDMSTNLSYQDQYPRSYYQPYNAQTNPDGYTADNSAIREQTMLKNAVDFIYDEVPLELDVDGDDDGYVDNVTFLISGSPDGWSDLLWPHRWSLYLYTVYINGSVVDSYNLNLASGGYFTVGTLCHEFFHSMGAPDLYHYNDNAAPTSAGGWDVMDGSANTPQYMGAWMKHKYGNWIDCPLIEQLGIYPLLPLQYQESNCFRINSPNSTNEFFIVEYRKKEGLYEVNTPGSDDGMLIYRINGNLNGNADGPPDEVYVYRPGGTTADNGNLTQAIFSAETGRTEINDSTDPSSFLYGDAPGGLNIQDIGPAGDIIEFTYWNIFIQTAIVGIENDNDGDGILNPGESVDLTLSANILSAPSNAENVLGVLSSDLDWVHFTPSEINFGSLPVSGSTIEVQTQLLLDNTDELMPVNFNLNIDANFTDSGTTIEYNDSFEYELDITLNQAGFPVSTAEIRSSPLVIDIDNNGDNEIIFGDYNGVIHIYNLDGSEYISNDFPFDTGSQIWGSAASADLDRDGYVDFAIPSKSKHLYIFDHMGLKLDYETEVYLIGTPAIGNLDDDEDMEIVFSGYSTNNKLFAINPDGSDVNGFPIEFGEKAKAGPALADFNENGKDDIIIGTDNHHVYLFYDDGSIAPGFPFTATNKFQAAPSIVDIGSEKIIFSGNNDNNLYAINSDGSLRFSLLTGDNVNTSPSFININNNLYVIIGSKDDKVYIVDIDGNTLPGFPITLNGNIEGGIVSSDIDGDAEPEILITSDAGTIFILHKDGSHYHHFPLDNGLPFTGPPLVLDLDGDGDIEVISGSLNNLTVIDIKESGDTGSNWNMFRGNNQRTGYFINSSDSTCSVALGDVNGDTIINILDLVQMANYVLGISAPTYECAADYNQDGAVNILDLVQTANYILEN